MIDPTAPASTPPAGESGRDAQADQLLHELQQGDRGAFERYHALYRVPVYDLVRRLLPDGDDVVSATDEVFTTAFRRIILQDGHIALRAWTYQSALDVCRETCRTRNRRRPCRRTRAPRQQARRSRTQDGLRRRRTSLRAGARVDGVRLSSGPAPPRSRRTGRCRTRDRVRDHPGRSRRSSAACPGDVPPRLRSAVCTRAHSEPPARGADGRRRSGANRVRRRGRQTPAACRVLPALPAYHGGLA